MHPMLASLKTDVNSNFVESLTTMGMIYCFMGDTFSEVDP